MTAYFLRSLFYIDSGEKQILLEIKEQKALFFISGSPKTNEVTHTHTHMCTLSLSLSLSKHTLKYILSPSSSHKLG